MHVFLKPVFGWLLLLEVVMGTLRSENWTLIVWGLKSEQWNSEAMAGIARSWGWKGGMDESNVAKLWMGIVDWTDSTEWRDVDAKIWKRMSQMYRTVHVY
jgi:hypothetical protein